MTTIHNNTQAFSLHDAKNIMADQIRSLPILKKKSRILRVSVSIERQSPLLWLGAQKNATKIYWEDRDGAQAVAGIGIAVQHRNDPLGFSPLMHDIQVDLHHCPSEGLRFFGGFCFDAGQKNKDIWHYFGQGQFILPQFEIIQNHKDTSATFIVNIAKPQCDSYISQILEQLRQIHISDAYPATRLFQAQNRYDLPNRMQWDQNIARSLDAIRKNHFQKIVLARKTHLSFKNTLQPLSLLKRLKEASPNCYYFCFQPRDGLAFIGASPERLYKRDHKTIFTEALAGTRPRSPAKDVDEQWGHDLLHSDKDRREHRYVIDDIRCHLETLCHTYQEDKEPQLLPLAGGQHLIYQFQGTLRDHVDDNTILNALSPTPAVGGSPQKKALQAITRLEPFERGWYAGPIGWVSPDAAEFAVGIRSGLIQDNQLYLFAGAGIVQGSTPEGEWDEIENKIGNFMKIISKKTVAGDR